MILFDKVELKNNIKKIPSQTARVFFTILYREGLRISELLNIKKASKKMIIKPLKNGQARIVNIEESELKHFPFLWSRQAFGQISRKYLNLSPHDLRHHHAIHSLQNNDSPIMLQYRLGHKSLSSTAVYLKFINNE